MTAPDLPDFELQESLDSHRWRGLLDGTPVEIRVVPTGLRKLYREMDGSPGQCQFHRDVEECVAIAPLSTPTLAEVRGPLPASAVAFVAIRLQSAMSTLAIGRPPAAIDVGLDLRGHPVLAPQHDAAGEGLAAMLFTLATGHPFTGSFDRLPEDLRSPLTELAAGRPSALVQLAPLAVPTDLRNHVPSSELPPATLDAGEVKLTVQAPRERRGNRDVRPPVAAVVVRPEVFATLPPAALSLLAGVSELPLAAVKSAQQQGRPFVVEPLYNASLLNTSTIQQQRALEMPLAGVKGPGLGRALELLFFGFVSFAAFAAALVASSVGVALVGLVAALLGLTSIWGGIRTAREKTAMLEAFALQEKARDEAATWTADIAARRRALADAELAEPVERDARGVLDALEAAVDPAEVTRGLLALDPLLSEHSPASKAPDRAERIAALARQAHAETR